MEKYWSVEDCSRMRMASGVSKGSLNILKDVTKEDESVIEVFNLISFAYFFFVQL